MMSITAAQHSVSREYFAEGAPDARITEERAAELLDTMLAQVGPLRRVLLLPPDMTRRDSWAGELTGMLYRRLRDTCHVEVLPTVGTHRPMNEDEIAAMFPGIPTDVFRPHHWRTDVITLGEVPAEFVEKISEDRLKTSIQVALNRVLLEGDWDRIFSIGQLVPHEVAGIANHNKNLFVGAGGADLINKSHYLGAVYGMERIMGRARTPVREVFNYASRHFAAEFPVTYLLTVRDEDAEHGLCTRGLYAGDGEGCFETGAELCRQVNVHVVDRPLPKVVVHMSPEAYHSTWLANKAIYRSRMALADGGELIVLAPGVETFGEKPEIDTLIRRFGYRGTDHVLNCVEKHPELAGNLSAAAHLIHGSSEGRFQITYCPGKLSREEIEEAGYAYGDLATLLARYQTPDVREGWNTTADGEEYYYIGHAGLGLWTTADRF